MITTPKRRLGDYVGNDDTREGWCCIMLMMVMINIDDDNT